MIQKLQISQFRNYSEKSFVFSPRLTLVAGPNTAGKTSLLEAIMLIATGTSFRAERDRDMIAFEGDVSRVKAVYSSIDSELLEVVLTRGLVLGKTVPLKKYLVDGIARRYADFAGRMPAVLFWPEDLRLITGSPARRRSYFDTILSQTDRMYRRAIMSYEKALRVRNKLLRLVREGVRVNPEEFDYWTNTLVTQGAVIHTAREALTLYANALPFDRNADCSFTIHYDHSTITSDRLREYHDAERAAGVTLVGPHRDDFYLTKNHDHDSELHNFGSRGEQRLGVLWLKMAEMQYIEQQLHVSPLLLLDDIFSELDANHRGLVVRLIGSHQTIMTTTDKHLVNGISADTMIELDIQQEQSC